MSTDRPIEQILLKATCPFKYHSKSIAPVVAIQNLTSDLTMYVIESFKNADSSSNETREVFMSESLNHSFKLIEQQLLFR